MAASTFTADSSYSHMISSTSSLSSNGSHSHPNVIRTYKQASQLFLTRRIAEALQTLEPIVHPKNHPSWTSPNPSTDDAENDPNTNGAHDISRDGSTYGTDGTASSDSGAAGAYSSATSTSSQLGTTNVLPTELHPPIAAASRPARVKVWSLYISMLNEIVGMGAEEGRKELGSAPRWKQLAKRVRDGTVWDDIINWGYGGNEAAVDADIIANLATLLLAHAPTQRTTQVRLETYLSATSGVPSAAALAGRFEQSPVQNGHTNGANNGGTSTPRDLGSRLKILEIYVLHVLPRNEEWEYAREFINMSEVLDEERREAFLNALEGLREDHDVQDKKEKELAVQRQREKEVEEERAQKEREAAERRTREQHARSQQEDSTRPLVSPTGSGTNESDFGVDKRRPNGSAKGSLHSSGTTSSHQSTASATKATASGGHRSATSGPPARKKPRGAPPRPPTLFGRVMLLSATIHQSLVNIGTGISRHPVAVLRTLLFLVALIMTVARQDVRQRLTRARDTAWQKIRQTVGMGVKVSYI